MRWASYGPPPVDRREAAILVARGEYVAGGIELDEFEERVELALFSRVPPAALGEWSDAPGELVRVDGDPAELFVLSATHGYLSGIAA